MSIRDWFRRTPSTPVGVAMGRLVGPKRVALPRGTAELLAAYSSMPWLRAINSRVSYMVGTTEWRLLQAGKDGSRKKSSNTLEEASGHPFLDLLIAGSPMLSGSTTLQVTQAQIDLVGEGYLLFEVNGVIEPTEMFNLSPAWVSKIPGFRSKSLENYEIQFPNESVITPVPKDQIVWIKDPDPSDPYGRGKGIAHALAKELDIDDAAAEHARDFFLNSARSDYIFIAPGVTKETSESFLEKWNSRHQGTSWKPSIINSDIKIEKMSQDFSGIGMPELRTLERDIIMQVYGMPPEVFGILTSSNRSTIDSADYLMAKYSVTPRLRTMRDPLQRAFNKFYPKDRMILDFVSPIAEDREFKKSVMVALPYVFYVDEHRELAGLPPLDNEVGQVFLTPFSLAPSDVPGGSTDVTPADVTPPKEYSAKVTSADIGRIIRRIDPKVLATNTKGVIFESIQSFGKEMVRDLGVDISFDIESPRVVDYLNLYSSEKIRGVNDTTKDKVRSQLSIGVERGESIPKLAARIDGIFGDQARTLMIARTETIAASNFGNIEAMTQADVQSKEWLATRDDATRDTHKELDGQVRALDEDFDSSSGAHGPYPGALDAAAEDINCRCSVLPVLGKTSIGDTEEKRVSLWKAKELSRLPFQRKMQRRVRVAFALQRTAVLAELNQLADQAVEIGKGGSGS